jgi:hypothetical protein
LVFGWLCCADFHLVFGCLCSADFHLVSFMK